MSQNLAYQIRRAIDAAFAESMDKNAAKGKHLGLQDKVFSYGERKNLLDTAHQLGVFVKETYGIKMVKNINNNMVQNFLNTKSNNCTQETLGQYKSRLDKIQNLINKKYNINVNWTDVVVPQSHKSIEKIRNIQMSREDLNAILNYCYSNNLKSKAVVALELASKYGLRVSEIVKLRTVDVNLEKMQLHIHKSKGGLSRDISINFKDAEYLKSITRNLEKMDRIVPLKEDSVNQFLNRIESKINLREKYMYSKSGIHSIRKLYSQEQFDIYREQGLTIKQSMDKLAANLGHGKGRYDTLKTYVSNIR